MFYIDVMSRTPVYEQIKSQLERFILNGTIAPGEQIPSVRSLSLELSINPNTILKAYSELDRMGLVHSVPGKGYFVCEDAPDIMSASKYEKLDELSAMLADMALAGIPKEEILQRVNEAYKKYDKEREDQTR